jgi:hypothetical protein
MGQHQYNLLSRRFVRLEMAFFETSPSHAVAGPRSSSTSPSMGRCWRRALRSVSNGRESAATRPTIQWNPIVDFRGSGARIRRIDRRPIPTGGCSRRARADEASRGSWVKCWWMTGVAWRSTRAPRRRPAPANGRRRPDWLRVSLSPRHQRGDNGFEHAWLRRDRRTPETTPHVALKKTIGRSTLGRRAVAATRSAKSPGSAEEVFGWIKTVGGSRKLRHSGGAGVNWQFLFTATACYLVRMRTLAATA